MRRKRALSQVNLLFLVLGLPLIFWPSAFDVFGSPKLLYLALVTFLSWAAFFLAGRKIKVNRQFYLWLIFFLFVVVSSGLSSLPLISFFGLRRRLLGGVTLLLAGLVGLAAAHQEWSKESLVKFSQLLLTVSLGVNLLGLSQALGLKYPLDLTVQFGRNTVATFGNPNYYGLFLVLILPFALDFALIKKGANQLLGWLALIASLLALIAINSTGAFLGFLASLLIYTWFKFRQQKFYYPLVTVLLVLTFTFLFLFWLPSEQANLQSRLVMWQATGKVISQNLFIGVGAETLRFHLFKYLTATALGRGFEDAHNLFLNYAASFGLPGVLAFILFLVSILIFAWKKAAGLQETVTIPFLAAIFGYLVAAQVNPEDIGSLPLFWLFLGVVLSKTFSEKQNQRQELNNFARAAFYLLIVAICLLALAFSTLTVMAELNLYKASIAQIPGESLVYFKRAQALVPFQTNYYTYTLMKLAPFWGTSPYFNDQLLTISKKGINSNPYEPQAWGLRGWLLKIAGEKSSEKSFLLRAAVNFEQALTIDPYDSEARQMLVETEKLLN